MTLELLPFAGAHALEGVLANDVAAGEELRRVADGGGFFSDGADEDVVEFKIRTQVNLTR